MVTLHTGHVAVATILKVVECDNAMKTAIRCYDNNKNVANIHDERRGTYDTIIMIMITIINDISNHFALYRSILIVSLGSYVATIYYLIVEYD